MSILRDKNETSKSPGTEFSKILIDVLSAYLCCASFNTKNPVHMGLEVEHKASVTHFTDHKRRTAPSHGFCHAHKLFTYLFTDLWGGRKSLEKNT